METQCRPAPVWIVLFDCFVARWLFAFIALSALGLALLTVLTHGWVHLVLSLFGQVAAAVVAGGIAVLTRSSARRRRAVICLLGDLAAVVPNLFGVGGHQWRGLLTAVLLVPVFVPAIRGALSAEPVDAIVGVQPTPAPSRSTRPSKRPSRRGVRQLVGAASASGGQAAGGWQSRAEQLGRLARRWQLLDNFFRHTFQTERDQYGRPVERRSRPPSGPGDRR